MKLNNRLFCKKSRFLTNCFSCFNAKKLVLVFFVGLFALSGLLAAEYVWTGGQNGTGSAWNDTGNWSGPENLTPGYPSNDGDIAVFDKNVSFPQMQDAGIAEGATIVLRVEEGYEVSFGDWSSAFDNRNFIVEKGNVSFGSGDKYGDITIGSNAKVEIKQVKVKSITNQGELTVTGQLQEVKENLIPDEKCNELLVCAVKQGENLVTLVCGGFYIIKN